MPSLETYGINVSRLAPAVGMKYVNGVNTVTYFGAVLFSLYLAIRPHKRQLLEKHIREGRILVGPWYVQNDFYLTSGEATVRNKPQALKPAVFSFLLGLMPRFLYRPGI